jgi:hypothetical protein
MKTNYAKNHTSNKLITKTQINNLQYKIDINEIQLQLTNFIEAHRAGDTMESSPEIQFIFPFSAIDSS